jgi:alginate O-acetyltransferase complex protein AlgI
LIAWGFFKKLVIADNLAIFINTVYSNPDGTNGPVSFVAIILFGFQLYADFSGYTDIALGTAKVLGFDLTQNFRRPFLARSIRDFWTRWHISLSSWCSDYIFLPVLTFSYDLKKKLKKSRYFHTLSAEKIMYVVASFITFFIIGIWHGVGWTYITVGLIFGFYVSFDMLTKDFRKKINAATGITKFPGMFQNIQVLTTFTLLLVIWLFFRASSMENAGIMFRDLFHGWSFNAIDKSYKSFVKNGFNGVQFVAGLTALFFLLYTDILSERRDFFDRLGEKPAWVRWSFYYLLVFSIILFGAVESKQFIYMQF